MVIISRGSLLIFSLGPVQSFIATARRTQDLWLGSCLLSDLIRAGMLAAQKAGAQLIYPAPEALKDSREGGLPNKFVTRCVDAESAQQAAKDATDAVTGTWRKRAANVRTYLERQGITIDAAIWTRQTQPNHLLEIYWAAVPWPKDQPYRQVYAEASRMLAARKNLRDFMQVEEPGRKCSLCGEREALAGRLSDKVAKQKLAERLCAVCAIKRFDAETRSVEERFPSTSSVAAAPFVLELLNNWADAEVFKGFKGALEDLEDLHRKEKHVLTRSAHPEAIPFLVGKGEAAIRHLDGDLYFPETFQPDGRLKNDYDFAETPEVLARAEVAQEKLQALRKAVQEATGQQPTPYYAVLLMDGDRMGQRLSDVQSEREHQSISQALFHFTQQVARIVEEEHSGRRVYAGGDDVLAFLPVAHVLPAAQKLRKAFGEALAGGTLSAGIAIAHHLSPLQAVLEEARAAERAAKDDYDRQALCVALLRRSGAATRVGARWIFGCGRKTVEILENVRKRMISRDLSGKLTYDVAEAAPVLGASKIPCKARLAEMRRLLRRHTRDRLPDDEKRAIENLAEPLVALAEALDKLPRCQRDDMLNGMIEMANWLLLVRFLAAEGRDEE